MKSNEDLQADVQDAIKWEPLLGATEIGVIVDNGVVTLTGHVDSYSKKIEAENATKSVLGVKAIVEKIDVKYPSGVFKVDDTSIAKTVLHALELEYQVPHEKVKVKVENGWVFLDGEVNWNYQKEAAKNSIKYLVGVKGVTNSIRIKPTTHDTLEQKSVEAGLKRNWAINTSGINVKVAGTKVTLSGYVDSLYQKDEAGRIAWNTPGICEMHNDIHVRFSNGVNHNEF